MEQQHLTESGGVHWSVGPPFSCGPVTQVHIKFATDTQSGSLPGIVLGDNIYVVLYIILQTKYGIVLGSEGIWNIYYSIVPGQSICGEESQGGHDQYVGIP